MPLLSRAAALCLVGLVAASCASFPGTTAELFRDQRRPVVVELPAYVSPNVDRAQVSVGALVDAIGRRIGASGTLVWRVKGLFEAAFDKTLATADYGQTAVLDPQQSAQIGKVLKATHVGVLDVLPGGVGKVLVYYRVVEVASQKVVLFSSALLERGQEASWAKTLSPAVINDDAQLLGPDSPSWASWWASAPAGNALTDRWLSLIAPARSRADFAEMRRLTDLAVDRLGPGVLVGPGLLSSSMATSKGLVAADLWARNLAAIRRETDGQERAVAVEREARSFLTELTLPATEVFALAALKSRILEHAQANSASLDASNRPAVRNAFLARFGVALPIALAQTRMLPVPAGTFLMGSVDGNPDEAPAHQVSVGAFWLGRTEVTQADYRLVMKTNPSLFASGDQAAARPVERVTWYDAVEFCNALSVQEGYQPVYQISKRIPAKGFPVTSATVVLDRSKDGYRLPTEAEWEWAARDAQAGEFTLLAGGADPEVVAWTDGKVASTSPVAQKSPNALGLYDMSGNVWEWCQDWYAKYTLGAIIDPIGPDSGVLKVGRGGSWRAAAWNSRVTGRSYDAAGSRGNVLGFRVARSITPFPVP